MPPCNPCQHKANVSHKSKDSLDTPNTHLWIPQAQNTALLQSLFAGSVHLPSTPCEQSDSPLSSCNWWKSLKTPHCRFWLIWSDHPLVWQYKDPILREPSQWHMASHFQTWNLPLDSKQYVRDESSSLVDTDFLQYKTCIWTSVKLPLWSYGSRDYFF